MITDTDRLDWIASQAANDFSIMKHRDFISWFVTTKSHVGKPEISKTCKVSVVAKDVREAIDIAMAQTGDWQYTPKRTWIGKIIGFFGGG